MRNLGLALVLVASITAPHAALAKKHPVSKRGRDAKAHKSRRATHAHESLRSSPDDQLARAVTAHKREEAAALTAAAPALPPPDPPVTNPPMSMSNQDSDDEVPGSRKKR
jgi:hypothetical protein